MATLSFQITSAPLTGTITYTGTDADMQAILDWAAVAYNDLIQARFNPTNAPGFVPTNAQIGRGLGDGTVRAWKDAIQRHQQQPAPPPPPQMTWV